MRLESEGGRSGSKAAASAEAAKLSASLQAVQKQREEMRVRHAA